MPSIQSGLRLYVSRIYLFGGCEDQAVLETCAERGGGGGQGRGQGSRLEATGKIPGIIALHKPRGLWNGQAEQ
jgi:hypothetical protein